MSNLFKGIVKLAEEQYKQLKKDGSITVGDITIDFDEYTLYVTDYSIDSEIDINSENAVSNKAIANALKEKANKSDIPDGVVTIDGEQNIEGNKNFKGNITKNEIDLATINDIPPIADSLDQNVSTSTLSAKQGKVLNDKINSLVENISGKVQSFSIDTLSEFGSLFGIELTNPIDSFVVSTNVINYKGKNYTLKTGDIFLIVDVSVPDYWFSLDDMTIYKLETSKIDLTNYVTNEKFEQLENEVNNKFDKSNENIANNTIEINKLKSSVKDVAIASSNIKYAISSSEEEISSLNEFISKTSNSTVRMRGCAYGNGIYVIVGTSGALQYSTNKGETWTLIPTFITNVIVSVAYGGGIFICVDSAGGIFKSSNCVEWIRLESPITDIINAIVYVNGKFALAGANGLIAFSNDATSFDIVNSGVTSELTSVTRGLDKYVAVSTSGDILVSINGIDWENKSVDTTHYRTATFGKNIFIIGGQGGKIKYSTDAINWIDATHDSTSSVNYIRDIKYANGKFYAVMYISTGQGEIWTSLDGATWTKTQTTSARLWCLGYGNDIFFASGDNGAIWVLNQNINWVDYQPSIDKNQYIWSKEIYYLTDGSILESEIEVYRELTELEKKVPNLDNYATKKFVEENSGKIDKIYLNGEEQTITNKEVNLEIKMPEIPKDYYKVVNKLSEIDLNTIVVPGNYGVANDCANMPVIENGTLFVGEYNNQTYVQQLFISSSNKIYVRTSTSVDNSSWTEWTKFLNTLDNVYQFSQKLYEESANIIRLVNGTYTTTGGITVTVTENNIITLNGNVTTGGGVVHIPLVEPLPIGTYSMNLFNTVTNDYNAIGFTGEDKLTAGFPDCYFLEGTSIGTSTKVAHYIYIYLNNRQEFNYSNLQFKVMLVKGNTIPKTFGFYNQKRQITNNEAEFLKEEHDKSKNKFDISKVKFALTQNPTIDLENGTITVYRYDSTSSTLLKDCTDLEVGKTYILSLTEQVGEKYIYLVGTQTTWRVGQTHTITQADLDNTLAFYGQTGTTNVISQIMISEEGGEYQPYNGEIIHRGDMQKIVPLTQEEYDALGIYDENTLYLIKEE